MPDFPDLPDFPDIPDVLPTPFPRMQKAHCEDVLDNFNYFDALVKTNRAGNFLKGKVKGLEPNETAQLNFVNSCDDLEFQDSIEVKANGGGIARIARHVGFSAADTLADPQDEVEDPEDGEGDGDGADEEVFLVQGLQLIRQTDGLDGGFCCEFDDTSDFPFVQ